MSDDRQLNPTQAQALELISYVAVNLVEHPDDVRVDLLEDGDQEVLRISVHPDDQGQLIGKNGQTARAIRTLLMAFSARVGKHYALDIVDR